MDFRIYMDSDIHNLEIRDKIDGMNGEWYMGMRVRVFASV